MAKQGKATMVAHSDAKTVTRAQLAKVKTPEGTQTWTPIPHHTVPTIIEEMVEAKGWSFAESGPSRFQLAVTETGSKMFGATEVLIPDLGTHEDFGLGLGFRNSHDKSIALQIAVGTRVFVCDNLAFFGDVKVRREHTLRIDARVTIEAALDKFPAVAQATADRFQSLQEYSITQEAGIAILAQCVEAGALPLVSFMAARTAFLTSYEEQTAIKYSGTLWAVYQAVTAQWKRQSLLRLPHYSDKLNQVIFNS